MVKSLFILSLYFGLIFDESFIKASIDFFVLYNEVFSFFLLISIFLLFHCYIQNLLSSNHTLHQPNFHPPQDQHLAVLAGKTNSAIIFCSTVRTCELLSRMLLQLNLPCLTIHGKMSQVGLMGCWGLYIHVVCMNLVTLFKTWLQLSVME